ncbi:MAG: N-carbamoyl-L-amino acid amidohydrolase [Patescibacteria group bacterium]
MFVERKSPYLNDRDRLADVVAMLQVMGTYKFASREIDKWGESLGRPPLSAESWRKVFEEHPEFFRLRDDLASLVWRRASERVYDTVTGKEITKVEADALSEEARKKLSRAPLSPEQVTSLIEVAIKLQTQAISRRQELRWWVPVLVGAIGIAIGALLKS